MGKKICSWCGDIITEPDGGVGSGYALDDQGNITCYACCAKEEEKYMQENGQIDLFLISNNKDKQEVTNWPGTLRFPELRYKEGKHNTAGIRRDVWFDFDGYVWHGVQYGNEVEICHCRKTKRKAVI